MASIPLPALDLKPPPAPPDQLDQYGRLMQLQQMRQQNQMEQQEAPLRMQQLQQGVQSGAMQNQVQQQQLNDQQAMTKAMQSWDGKDVNDLVPLVIKNGASANAVMGLKSKVLAQQQTYSTIAKNDAATGASNLTTMKGKNDLIAGALAPLLDQNQTPDAQLPQAVMATAQDLVQKGLLDPQHAQAAEQLGQSGNPTQIRQQLSLMQKSLMGQSQQMTAAQQQERVRHDTAIEAQTAATSANTAAYRNSQLRLSAQRNTLAGARLKFQQAQAGISDDGTPNPLAQAIASGHLAPDRMGYLLARNPGLLQGVMEVDPSFDASKAQSYPATYKDFTSGKTSIALNAGGTALTHLQELSTMNTDASHIYGTPAYNAYQNKADTVASELAKFYGDATIPAIDAIKKTLTATLPGNRQAAIETQAKSMGDKLDAYQQTWDNAAPSKSYQAPMPGISSKAMAAREALDPSYKNQSAQPSIGAVKTFPNGKTGKWDGTGWVAQ